jgi:rare lipoprotein A
MFLRLFAVFLLSLGLAACSSTPDRSVGRGTGTPGEFKIGQPYDIGGVTYYPKEDYSYDETGIASWYGPGFEGKQTANGETFDPNELTGAHRTLPMPSLVRVTNLDNGRSVVIRVNDRGPFAHGRIIDLSRRAAQLLDIHDAGTAKVRVKILEIESRAIADAARRRGYVAPGTSRSMIAQAQPRQPAPYADTSDQSPPIEIPRGEMTQAETITETASVTSVEAAPLDAPPGQRQEAEQPVAAPKNATLGAVPPKTMVVEPKPASIPGKRVGGRFLPAPEVKQMKVTGQKRIFVQAGAFSVKTNADRLKKKLSALAPTSISETTVKGTRFYRVRLGPIKSVAEADRILEKVLGQNTKAQITVE